MEYPYRIQIKDRDQSEYHTFNMTNEEYWEFLKWMEDELPDDRVIKTRTYNNQKIFKL